MIPKSGSRSSEKIVLKTKNLVRPGSTQAKERGKGGKTKRGRNDDDRRPHGIEQNAEQKRRERLRGARRRTEETRAFPIAMRPEDSERHGAARDRQKPVAGAVENGEGRSRRGSDECKDQRADGMQERREPRRHQRVASPQQKELGEP